MDEIVRGVGFKYAENGPTSIAFYVVVVTFLVAALIKTWNDSDKPREDGTVWLIVGALVVALLVSIVPFQQAANYCHDLSQKALRGSVPASQQDDLNRCTLSNL